MWMLLLMRNCSHSISSAETRTLLAWIVNAICLNMHTLKWNCKWQTNLLSIQLLEDYEEVLPVGVGKRYSLSEWVNRCPREETCWVSQDGWVQKLSTSFQEQKTARLRKLRTPGTALQLVVWAGLWRQECCYHVPEGGWVKRRPAKLLHYCLVSEVWHYSYSEVIRKFGDCFFSSSPTHTAPFLRVYVHVLVFPKQWRKVR